MQHIPQHYFILMVGRPGKDFISHSTKIITFEKFSNFYKQKLLMFKSFNGITNPRED
jgi:hypothetical protein